MDKDLSNIIRKSGFSFSSQYSDAYSSVDNVTYKFVSDRAIDSYSADSKKIIETVKTNLNAAKFLFNQLVFTKNERAKGPDYWTLVVRRPRPAEERPLDRDIHGNLIYADTKKRAA